MFRSSIVALVSTMLIASAAAAAPTSLAKGHWSLGYQASEGANVQLGIGVADMTRIIVSASVQNSKPGDDGNPATPEPESTTGWSVAGAFHRYLGGMATDHFAPFFGGAVGITDSGSEGADPSFGVEGRFGGEAFVIDALSIGGFIGVGYKKQGDTEVTQGNTTVTVEGDKTFGTVRSGITATLYWGGAE